MTYRQLWRELTEHCVLRGNEGTKVIVYTFYFFLIQVLVVKNPPANAGDIRDVGSVPEWGRSPGGGYGNLLQYS